jgi:K+-sensing histidine kinase KdpD
VAIEKDADQAALFGECEGCAEALAGLGVAVIACDSAEGLVAAFGAASLVAVDCGHPDAEAALKAIASMRSASASRHDARPILEAMRSEPIVIALWPRADQASDMPRDADLALSDAPRCLPTWVRAAGVARSRVASAVEGATRELSAFKTRYLAMTSHELRTPLNSIINFAWLLQHESESLDPDSMDLAARIEESGKRLLAVLDDILKLAKLDDGTLKAEAKPTPLDPVVAEVAESSSQLFVDTPVKFVFEPGAPGTSAMIDPEALRQALRAIIAASARCVDKGKIAVETGVDDGKAFVRVIDSGPDWPEGEASDDRFEEVAYARPVARALPLGAGPSLSVARRLAELTGAEFKAWRPASGGAAFSMAIPIA